MDITFIKIKLTFQIIGSRKQCNISYKQKHFYNIKKLIKNNETKNTLCGAMFIL